MFNKIPKSVIHTVPFKNNLRGFTLVEMVLALAISTIVLAAVYSVFTIANKNFTTQNAAAQVQQNLRSAIRLMARDIRHAGLDPSGSDNFGITHASANTISFTMDSEIGGVFNGIVDEANWEEITYDFQGDQIIQTLYQTVTTSTADTAALISNIKEFKFKYYDSANNDLGEPGLDPDQLADIRTVEISVTHWEPAGRDKSVIRTLRRRVECRNLTFD